MIKVRRISHFQSQFSFPSFDQHFEKHMESFRNSELGAMYAGLPFDDLVKAFALKEHHKGPNCTFSPKGKIALMYLKHYACTSDERLIEQLNGNIYYQIFCDMILEPGQQITNFKIVSQIRCELAATLDIHKVEDALMKHWKPYMSDLSSITCDATCYESDIKFPTDIKLLYDSVEWLHAQIIAMCKKNGLRKPRTKYDKWVRKAISYSKMKKKRVKKRRSVTRGLLRLLTKLIGIMKELEGQYGPYELRAQYLVRKSTIEKILEQQSKKFYEGQRPAQAIVSIDKPYVRPIVRGKENKAVEFGAKVHKLQIDGISFIEHLSFGAFHEGNRLQKTIWRAQKLTGKKVKILGADAIYATNKNRSYMTKRSIQTDFKPKGRPGKHKKHKLQIASMITKERASALEGSFGTDKNYFHLKRIKARTEQTERFWIFLGIHASNAIKIGRRIQQSISQAA